MINIERIKTFCRLVILGRQPCDYGKDDVALHRLKTEAEEVLEKLNTSTDAFERWWEEERFMPPYSPKGIAKAAWNAAIKDDK